MPKFIAYLKQKGEGCDYTIGCGQKLISLKGNHLEEANENLKEEIRENYSSDNKLKSATIYQVESEHTLNLESLYQLIEAEQKTEQEENEFIEAEKRYKLLLAKKTK